MALQTFIAAGQTGLVVLIRFHGVELHALLRIERRKFQELPITNEADGDVNVLLVESLADAKIPVRPTPPMIDAICRNIPTP